VEQIVFYTPKLLVLIKILERYLVEGKLLLKMLISDILANSHNLSMDKLGIIFSVGFLKI
jgi:hypothetical protein